MTELTPVLAGTRILVTAQRRSDELAGALMRRGADVVVAPTLGVVPHIDEEELLRRTREVLETQVDTVVVTTGIGFRGWMDTAEAAGLGDELVKALRDVRLVARGPKARGALQAVGLRADWVAESETSTELGEYLLAEGVSGRRIAVQHHGSGADGLDELFEAQGAEVVSLTVYRWGPPPDEAVVRRSVAATAAGEVDAVLFTSAPGAAEWLAAARREDVLDDIIRLSRSGRVLMAAVGPITAGPLERLGLTPLQAERGRLGSLVRAVVTHFGGGHAPALDTVAGRLEIRSSGVVLEGAHIPLSRTGVDVLAALFDAAGGVVSRARLQCALPRSGENTHAIEMAVARVREAVGAPELIKTVVKRGYRLNVIDPADALV